MTTPSSVPARSADVVAAELLALHAARPGAVEVRYLVVELGEFARSAEARAAYELLCACYMKPWPKRVRPARMRALRDAIAAQA